MLDVYFQPEYGKLYEKIEGGICETFEYKGPSGIVRNLYIKRPVPWLVDGIQYYDVTTPYGYGGPVIAEGKATQALINDYFAAWSQYCRNNKIICEFVRFHLLDNNELREAYPGTLRPVSDNVVRFLNTDMDSMWMEFEHKVRKNVKKAQSNGLSVVVDDKGQHLNDFLKIYYSTMERNNARDYYYFDSTYFQRIIDTLEGHYNFFHVYSEGKIISTELVLCSDKYVYSFLGGTYDEFYPLRPNDLLKYEIIKWSKETNHTAFILGGGYGGNDGIYRYKKSFAPGDDVLFYVGRMVHNSPVYYQIVEVAKNLNKFNKDFFPQYRG